MHRLDDNYVLWIVNFKIHLLPNHKCFFIQAFENDTMRHILQLLYLEA